MAVKISKVCLILAIIVLELCNHLRAEVITFKTCPENSCEIHEVRVDPCPQAENSKVCNIRRRKPATMSFDFTPSFDAETLEANLHWVKNDDQLLPLISMEKDACQSTNCPLKKDEKRTYSIEIPIQNKFPIKFYNIKWSFVAPDGNQCCFTHGIKLVR